MNKKQIDPSSPRGVSLASPAPETTAVFQHQRTLDLDRFPALVLRPVDGEGNIIRHCQSPEELRHPARSLDGPRRSAKEYRPRGRAPRRTSRSLRTCR